MFVAVMAFFAKVSDPAVGGTYMTFLNTMSNLGTNWPNTLALWAIDHLTYKACTTSVDGDNVCASPADEAVSKKNSNHKNNIVNKLKLCLSVFRYSTNEADKLNLRINKFPRISYVQFTSTVCNFKTSQTKQNSPIPQCKIMRLNIIYILTTDII